MTHRVVVLGAGYAGLPAAKRLARQVYPDEVSVELVTESPRFVERPRLHQLATGQRLRDLPLTELLAGSAVRLRIGRACAIDRAQQAISVATENGVETVAYDTLVYALGSTIKLDSVPGVPTYARALTGPDASGRMRSDLTRLPARGTVAGLRRWADRDRGGGRDRRSLPRAPGPAGDRRPPRRLALPRRRSAIWPGVSSGSGSRCPTTPGSPRWRNAAAAGRRPRRGVRPLRLGRRLHRAQPWPPRPVWRSTRGDGS